MSVKHHKLRENTCSYDGGSEKNMYPLMSTVLYIERYALDSTTALKANFNTFETYVF